FKGFTWAFTTLHAGFWQPLTWLSLMLDYTLYGMNAGGYHWTNVLFHIANSILVFLVLKQMTGARWQSGVVAALFALHPLHVESVAWVTERKDVLSGFFWMLTMGMYAFYVQRPAISRYLLVLLVFTLGLMTKPMLVTLPFVLLLLDYWPLKRIRITISRLVLEKIPFIVLSILLSVATFYAQRHAGGLSSLDVIPLHLRTANALNSYVSYIEKMVWPHNLAIFYPYSDVAQPMWQTILFGLFILFVGSIVVYMLRSYPYLAVGWFWYLGTLVPVSGIVQTGGQAMADRFTYIPLLGLFIMIAWGIPDLIKTWHYRKEFISIMTGTILVILTICTWLQLQHWQNNRTIFENALNVTKNNYVAHSNMGSVLLKERRFNEAIVHFAEAIRIKPDDVEACNNLGYAYIFQGDLDRATFYFLEATRIKPDHVKANNNLGHVFLKQKRFNEAINQYREVLRVEPENAMTHNHIGLAYAYQGDLDRATFYFLEAIRLKPDYADAHNNLGNLFLSQKKFEAAQKQFQEALLFKPDFATAHYNMGLVLIQSGDITGAIQRFRQALRIDPDNERAKIYLSKALEIQQRLYQQQPAR
ncbi:MAG: tetratricopeptide repeat protein, partial [Proteobacteria bacterium]|nr:tetratricopeptide repeat protein [Pseudomonadota bacterium]